MLTGMGETVALIWWFDQGFCICFLHIVSVSMARTCWTLQWKFFMFDVHLTPPLLVHRIGHVKISWKLFIHFLGPFYRYHLLPSSDSVLTDRFCNLSPPYETPTKHYVPQLVNWLVEWTKCLDPTDCLNLISQARCRRYLNKSDVIV
jgi:hypothetical protein